MTRVGNVDQVLLLLREQLQRSTRNGLVSRRSGTDRTGKVIARPLDRVRALAALEDLPEDEVRRAVVRGMLTESFGEEMNNDAAFNAVIDEVTRMIDQLPGGTALMQQAIAQLKGQP